MEPKKLRVIISSNVKYYRFSNRITQEELAERCGLSARYIGDIENDKGNIPVDTLEKIAKILKVKPHLLLKDSKHRELPKRVNMDGLNNKKRKKLIKIDFINFFVQFKKIKNNKLKYWNYHFNIFL